MATNANVIKKQGDMNGGLHIKMCKKIAQLTKVIYELNTLNEDLSDQVTQRKHVYTEEMKKLADKYESEKNSLHLDLMEQIEQKEKSLGSMEHKLHQLQREYESQKEKWIQERLDLNEKMRIEFEAKTKQHSEDLSRMKSEMCTSHKQQISLIERQHLQQRQSEEQKQLLLFEKKLQSSKNKLEGAQLQLQKTHRTEIANLQKHHTTEMKNLRQEYNSNREKLKHELLIKQQEALFNERSENNKKLVDLQNELNQQEQKTMASLKSQYTADLQNHQKLCDQRISRIQKEKEDVEQKLLELRECLVSEKQQIDKAKRMIADLNHDLKEQVALSTRKSVQFETNEKTLNAQISALSKRLETFEKHTAELKQEVSVKESKIKALSHTIEKLNTEKESEIKSLNNTIEKLNTENLLEVRKHNDMIHEKENIISNIQIDLCQKNSKVKELNNQIVTLKEESSNRQKEVVKKNQEELKSIQLKNKKSIKTLNQSLSLAKKAEANAKAKADDQNVLFEKNLRVLKESSMKRLQNLESEWSARLQQSNAKHSCTIQDLRQTLQSNEIRYKDSLQQTHASKQEIEDRLKETIQRNEILSSKMNATMIKIQSDFVREKSELQKNMDTMLQKRIDESTSNIQNQYQSHIDKLSNELKELDLEKQNFESNINAERTKNNLLQKELMEQKCYNLRLKDEHAKINHELEILDTQKIHLESNISTINSEKDCLEKRLQDQLHDNIRLKDTIEKLHHDYKNIIQEASKQESSRAKEQLELLEIENQSIRDTLAKERVLEINELHQSYQEKIQSITQECLNERRIKSNLEYVIEELKVDADGIKHSHNEEIISLRDTLNSKYESDLNRLKITHDEKVLDIERKYMKKISSLEKSYVERTEDQTINYNKTMKNALATLRDELNARHTNEINEIQREFMIHKTKSREESTALSEELERWTNCYTILANGLKTKQKDLSALKLTLERVKVDYKKNVLSHQQQYVETLIPIVFNKIMTDTERNKRDRISEVEYYKNLLHESDVKLQAILQKWEKRDARPEDIKKIRELEKELAMVRAKERKAYQEMAFYKRELVNREENYNQIFSRPSPNRVGVMNVVNRTNNSNGRRASTASTASTSKRNVMSRAGRIQRRHTSASLPRI